MSITFAMTAVGHLRRLGGVRAMSGFPQLAAEKRAFRLGCGPFINCGPTELAVIHLGGVRPERQRTKGY